MSTRPPSRRSGFTLIEVAVALALFVIGALAIVRIFPPALGVIRNNESRSTAVSLAESTLAKFQDKTSLPPEAIFDVDISGGWTDGTTNWQDFPAAIVTGSSTSSSLPKQPTDDAYNASALGHFRYIYGEPHYIGDGQTILLNRPRASKTDTGVDIPPTAFVDNLIEGVQISADGYLDFSNAYITDDNTPFYDSANPTLPPGAYRREDGVTYYVSYRWRECSDTGCTNDPPIQGVIEEPMTIADLATSARVLPCNAHSQYRTIPGAVKVRMRRYVTFTPNDESGGSSGTTTTSISATSAGIYYTNYVSSDWRTLVYDDSPIPEPDAPTTGTVHLPIGGIDNSQSVSGYLSRSDKLTSTTPLAPLSVDYKTGDIKYSIGGWMAPRVRTVYRTLDNWAQQLSVAPRSYIPYDSNRGTSDYPREPWREYSWSSSDPSMMYFHPSEAGKTIAISFYDGGVKVDSICTIDEDLVDRPGSVPSGFIGPGNTDSKVARMYITDPLGNTIAASSILSVQGLSIRARTAWLNNDRYNQVIVPGYRTLTQNNS